MLDAIIIYACTLWTIFIICIHKSSSLLSIYLNFVAGGKTAYVQHTLYEQHNLRELNGYSLNVSRYMNTCFTGVILNQLTVSSHHFHSSLCSCYDLFISSLILCYQ